ncbi:MAG: hypothetical protein JWM11_4214 [Planctomycetaceae bacterium]|nr:hypothetical protein [Planctomycetaceae bacterium]
MSFRDSQSKSISIAVQAKSSTYQLFGRFLDNLQMGEIPVQLLEGLSLAAMVEARVWWARLADVDCFEVIALCSSDDAVIGAPKVFGGRFVPTDEAAGWAEWRAACFEDLIAQPDPMLYEPPYFRTIYIG